MTDKTQELDEILEGVANEYSAGGNYENAKPFMVEEAKQAILDWHNKQIEAVLDRLESMAAYDPSGSSPVINPRQIEAERKRINKTEKQ